MIMSTGEKSAGESIYLVYQFYKIIALEYRAKVCDVSLISEEYNDR